MVSSAAHATPVAGPARASARSAQAGARPGGSRAVAVLAIAALTVLGAVLRVLVAGQSLFGDELSTYWIVSTNDLPGVVSIVQDKIEITPPLYFVAAWLTTQVDVSPELLRAPSLLAGTAAIPLVYLIGLRTVGRSAALVAAAFAALGPFMIYYSAEARAYQLALVLVLLATLALLTVLERGGARWWLAYGACMCAAAYAHYTCVFALAAQLCWVLWAHPEARRPALLTCTGALLAYVPWLPGFVDDLGMPDSRIMSELSPLTWFTARLTVEHWSVGYPYVTIGSELRDLPGISGLTLQALGLALGAGGAAVGAWRARARPGRRLVLVVALALSAPLGELAVTLIGTNMFTVRNLAVSWPWFALVLAAVLVAAGPRLRFVAAGLVLAGFALSAMKMVEARFQRPDFAAAAAIIDREAGPADGVVDNAVALITPGPITGLDAALQRRHRVLRAGAPQSRDGNFRIGDEILPPAEVLRRAAADGGRVFVVSPEQRPNTSASVWDPLVAELPGSYRRVRARVLRGFIPLAVLTYEPAR
jgi:4-amino-4-deoxy-L-arabinose transferase-like glycosyltransferase